MSSLRIAACPLLIEDGHLRVVLVTGRRHGELLLPKGHPEPDMTRPQVAELEAWEEAGIVGRAQPDPHCFTISRHRGSERSVVAYLMEVQHLASDWPEAHQRHRVIIPIDQLQHHGLALPWRRCVLRLGHRFQSHLSGTHRWLHPQEA